MTCQLLLQIVVLIELLLQVLLDVLSGQRRLFDQVALHDFDCVLVLVERQLVNVALLFHSFEALHELGEVVAARADLGVQVGYHFQQLSLVVVHLFVEIVEFVHDFLSLSSDVIHELVAWKIVML